MKLHQPQPALALLGGLTLVLCTLGGISAASGGLMGGGGAGGGSGSSGGARGSGMYNYGISGAGMRRGAGVYGPVGLGNPHDAPRYLHPGQGGDASATKGPSSSKSGHHRLSAWGIITIVTFVILIGAGAYWGFICYPFFCKKESSYNMMLNMSSATTATPSTRSTEFEKLDHCCSKSTTSTRSNDTGISNI
ncbi:putative glycine-rich cell wall structural protein 1 [Anopheles stephensi]|uniref:Uncharacterized protein n=1 Tax=Anopheles stephensi TaxID=30069 RepID=A0A182Y677_ANOST|nr:putative glycine-rich cell wall structural protein 1 [Anopheles stephensi]